MREITLTEHEAGQRLDRYLRKLLRTVPLSAIFRLVRNGSILVNGAKVAGDLRLLPGMRVQLRLPDADLATATADAGEAAPPAQARAPEFTPRIVKQDEHLLVLDKPPGLSVHGGTGQQHSVVDWLKAQRFGVRTTTFAPAPAHRLDRGTSGLLLVGLTPDALRSLTAAFRDGKVKKVYHAVVHGIPAPKRGSIRAALRTQTSPDGLGPKVVVAADGDPATTDYDVGRTTRTFALLRIEPHEGRQHQIRAHLAHLGHPIAGDRRYGSAADMGRGFLLHASELTFPHPRTGKPLNVKLPVPDSFLSLFATD